MSTCETCIFANPGESVFEKACVLTELARSLLGQVADRFSKIAEAAIREVAVNCCGLLRGHGNMATDFGLRPKYEEDRQPAALEARDNEFEEVNAPGVEVREVVRRGEDEGGVYSGKG